MKRGKDEEKMMGPMFPRLHVNDTEKRGPRAPPRNKMALYEQLSIPSQRFSHGVLPFNPNSTAVNMVPPSSQGGRNERVMFFSHQLPPRHQTEQQYSQYSDLSTPLTQIEQRKKMDEDDFRVPNFIHSIPSQECGKDTNGMDGEKLSPSNPSHFNHTSQFEKSKKMGMPEGLKKQTDSSVCHEPGDDPATSIDRLKTDDSLQPELCADTQPARERRGTAVSRENMAAVDKRNSSTSVRTSPSEDSVHDLSDYTDSEDTSCRLLQMVQPELCAEMQPASERLGTTISKENMAAVDKRNSSTSVRTSPSENQNSVHALSDIDPEDTSCSRLLQMGSLERGDSVSETSVVDSISELDVTPDDVVGVIGQKHFWKARRAIATQQRVFAVQVFELHRLIKVQRLIAASPHLLLENTAYLSRHLKALPTKKLPLNYPIQAIPNVSKQKGDAENTLGKSSFSSIRNDTQPSSCTPFSGNSPAPSISSDHNARPWCFNQPHGHHWLIPVMSPSEGLVYKPYPGPGFLAPTCGGFGPQGSNSVMMGNFVTPPYGVPAPHPQYPFPSFPPSGPHAYFPPYGMPIMNTAGFSGSSDEQTNAPAMKGQFSAGEANGRIPLQNSFTIPSQKNEASPDTLDNVQADEDIEVQASTTSSPSRASKCEEGRNVLPLFPMSPANDPTNPSPQPPEPERPTQVIKVVPHNPRTATESVARIFRSIQEERKQHDSV